MAFVSWISWISNNVMYFYNKFLTRTNELDIKPEIKTHFIMERFLDYGVHIGVGADNNDRVIQMVKINDVSFNRPGF